MSDRDPAVLTVAITIRALFDMAEEHAVFLEEGPAAYQALQRGRLDQPPAPGQAFGLAQKLLSLNDHTTGQGGLSSPLVELVILSRNDAQTGLRITRALDYYGLPIARSIWTQGEAPYPFLAPMQAHLFLSAEAEDVQQALKRGQPGALVMGPASSCEGQLRLAFDFDCVLASDEAEQVFRREGVSGFHPHERARREEAISPGPFQPFLKRLCMIQQMRPGAIRTGLFTARMAPAHERPLHSLEAWGVEVDAVFFLGGRAKAPFLREWKADLFLDDSATHVEAAAASGVPSALAG
jgi:5'-nucleotidase